MEPDEEEIEQPEADAEDALEEEVTDEETPESEDAPEAPAEDAPEEPEAPVAPFPVAQGEGPAQARLREMLEPETYSAVQAAIAEQVSRAVQSMGVAQSHYAHAAAESPEFFRVYGPRVSSALAMLPDDLRNTRKGVDIAMLFAVEDKAGTAEFIPALNKMMRTLGATPAAPKPPKAPIPAAQRPPSPTTGTVRAASTPRESRIKFLMKDADLSRQEAEDVLRDERMAR